MTHLWDDPPESVQREFKHGPWSGMPTRHEWNSSPNHTHMLPCEECGYKWGETDFSYRAHPSRPVERHRICWNCWMLDNNPEQVTAHWSHVDSTKPAPREAKGFSKIHGQAPR
jgi:hypothetical protein